MNNDLEVKIIGVVDKANQSLERLIELLNKGSDAIDKTAKTSDKLDKVSKSADKIAKALNFGTMTVMAKRFFRTFMDGIENINSYSETLNMFNLVMGEVQEKANKFQSTMAKNFGNNSQEQMYYQSLYQSLTESMGMQEKYAYIISENMTKLAYDLSSLYDKDQKVASEALRAGLIGQTKPVRSFGLDITENSLQPILDSLGIDRTVRELSQAEKEIARYLAMIKQSAIAHGDMANTIESPANQLRIFKNQLVECSRWFGNLFIGLFAKAMPYINGFIMAITEVMKALASLFGIEIQDYNSGIVTLEDNLDEGFSDVGSGVADTTKKVKELKREILGFDQINNINEPSDTGGSGGSGSGGVGAGGIDQRLLDALKGYDNAMDRIRMKALDIRNAILDWLGFLLDGDKIVGYSLIKGLKNLWNWFKKLNTAGKLLVSIGIGLAVSKLISTIKKLNSALGVSGLYTNAKEITKIFKNLKYAISTEGLSGGLDLWSGTLTGAEKLKTTLIGAGGLLLGWSLVTDAMREFNKTGEYTTKSVLTGLAGGLSNVFGGALIGATYGGSLGAIIGGITGGLVTLIEVLAGLESEEQKHIKTFDKKIEKINKVSSSYLAYNKEIDKNTNSLIAEQKINDDYIKELQNIVDANGNIKKGYEERAKFILNQLSKAYGIEYEIVNGQIKNYKDLIKTINETIEAKKIEILMEANQEKYVKAITDRTKNWNNYQKALKLVKEAQENLMRVSDIGNSSFNPTTDIVKWQEELKKAEKELKLAEKTWNETVNNITTYEDLWNANTSQNLEEMREALQKFTGENNLSLSEQISMWKNYGDRVAQEQGKVNESTYSMLDTTISTLKSSSQTLDSMTPEIVKAWNTLGEESKEKFNEAIKGIPADVRAVLYTEQLKTINDITPDVVKSYNTLAKNNSKKYKEELNKLPTDVKNALLTNQTAELKKATPEMIKAWGNLATSDKEEFKKQIKKLPPETRSTLITDMNKAGYDTGSNLAKGVTQGMNAETKKSSFFSGLSVFASNVRKSIFEVFDIHSPAKTMYSTGSYITLGIVEGMKQETPTLKKTANTMLEGLNTTFNKGMQDLSLKSAIMPNLNQNISNISTYKANTDINYNMLEQASYNGFSRAVQRYGLVRVNVKQDKGSIVETAIEGINDITKQTGENPIDLW